MSSNCLLQLGLILLQSDPTGACAMAFYLEAYRFARVEGVPAGEYYLTKGNSAKRNENPRRTQNPKTGPGPRTELSGTKFVGRRGWGETNFYTETLTILTQAWA